MKKKKIIEITACDRCKRDEEELPEEGMKDTRVIAYEKAQGIKERLNEHQWSRQLTNYDGRFIAYLDKQLLELCNMLYRLTQERQVVGEGYQEGVKAERDKWVKAIDIDLEKLEKHMASNPPPSAWESWNCARLWLEALKRQVLDGK